MQPCLNKAVLFTSYCINNEFIAQQLCENRKQAAKNCHGKCYLKKQMRDSESKSAKVFAFKEFSEMVCESNGCFAFVYIYCEKCYPLFKDSDYHSNIAFINAPPPDSIYLI